MKDSRELSPGMFEVLNAISDGEWHNAEDEIGISWLINRDFAVDECVDGGLAEAKMIEVNIGGITGAFYDSIRITEAGQEALRTGKY